jgi:hypothetical protein
MQTPDLGAGSASAISRRRAAAAGRCCGKEKSQPGSKRVEPASRSGSCQSPSFPFPELLARRSPIRIDRCVPAGKTPARNRFLSRHPESVVVGFQTDVPENDSSRQWTIETLGTSNSVIEEFFDRDRPKARVSPLGSGVAHRHLRCMDARDDGGAWRRSLPLASCSPRSGAAGAHRAEELILQYTAQAPPCATASWSAADIERSRSSDKS